MPIREVIEFSADDKKLIAAIGRINQQLQRTQGNADELGNSFSGAGSKAQNASNKITRALRKVADSAKKAALGVKNIAVGMTKLVAVAGVGAAVALRTFTSSLREVGDASTRILQIRSLGNEFIFLENAIDAATNGLLDMQSKIKLAGLKNTLNLSLPKTKQLSRIIASLGVSSGAGALRVTELLEEGFVKGTFSEELSKISPTLFDLVMGMKEYTDTLNPAARRQVLLNAILNKTRKIIRETGDIINDPFAKLAALSNVVNSRLGETAKLLGGIAKIAGVALAPIAGGFAAFALGGPVIGSLGIIVGGILSSALVAFASKLGGTIGSENNKVLSKFVNALGDLLSNMVKIFVQILGGGTGRFSITRGAAKSLGGMKIVMGIARTVGMAAISLREFSDSFIEGLGGIKGILDTLFGLNMEEKERLTQVSDIIQISRNFGADMSKFFKDILGIIFDVASIFVTASRLFVKGVSAILNPTEGPIGAIMQNLSIVMGNLNERLEHPFYGGDYKPLVYPDPNDKTIMKPLPEGLSPAEAMRRILGISASASGVEKNATEVLDMAIKKKKEMLPEGAMAGGRERVPGTSEGREVVKELKSLREEFKKLANRLAVEQ